MNTPYCYILEQLKEEILITTDDEKHLKLMILYEEISEYRATYIIKQEELRKEITRYWETPHGQKFEPLKRA